MATSRGEAGEKVLASLDSVVDLEFYMPVPKHWEAWRGDSDLFVAGALDDHDAPIGFDLAGRAVPLSAAEPPATPVLVLVPVETDFSSERARLQGAPVSPSASTEEPPGVYMTSSYIQDHGRYEGWTAGQTEFEVHAFVQNNVGTFVDVQCAGNEQGYPLQYDQNSDFWSGRVLLILETGIGEHQVEFQVWEDDNGACTWNGGRPPKTTDATRQAFASFAAKIVDVAIESGAKLVKAIIMAVPAAFDLASELNRDDPVGAISLRGPQNGCWYSDRATPFDVLWPETGEDRGTVELDVTFGEKTPICPLDATMYGPNELYYFGGVGNPYPWYSASVTGGSGPIAYEWWDNGVFKSTAGDYVMSPVTVGEHSVLLRVTRGAETVSRSKNVTVHEGDCGGDIPC